MQPAESAIRQHVIARLTDYCTSEGISWTRRLWDVGSVLALEELCEIGVWQPKKVIAGSAMDWQRRELHSLIGPDLGLGSQELRRALNRLLISGDLTDPGPGHRRLRHLVDHARTGYLDRWAAALRAGCTVKPERLSRTLAAHLLDLGFTATFLTTNWITELRKADNDLIEIVDSAAELARQPARNFSVLLPLNTVPKRQVAESTDGWIHKAQVARWLKANGHENVSGVRSGGAFVYEITARDPYGAAEQVRQIYERMLARAVFLRKSRSRLTALPQLWVAGHPEPLPLEGQARGADVLTLSHTGHLYDVHGRRSAIDDALELAAPINHAGAPGPAVAGAWAAVESLLAHPGDPVPEERSGKAVAADRLAAIVACSWPRAELTTLVHRHCSASPADDLARWRDGCSTNQERARVLMEEIAAHGLVNLRFTGPTRHSDLAAAHRMRDCIAEPTRVLGDVSRVVRVAMRRLYRARNVVLHGGSTASVVLDAALRTAAPLVGAGLDRIAHHHFDSGMRPLALAARAELAAELVNGETGLSLVDLLEQP